MKYETPMEERKPFYIAGRRVNPTNPHYDTLLAKKTARMERMEFAETKRFLEERQKLIEAREAAGRKTAEKRKKLAEENKERLEKEEWTEEDVELSEKYDEVQLRHISDPDVRREYERLQRKKEWLSSRFNYLKDSEEDLYSMSARIIDTPELLDELVDEYRVKCIAEERRMTMAGLCLHLGFTSRTQLHEYGSKYPEFKGSVERARLIIEEGWEERLDSASATGAIFWLKNHAGYADRQDVNHMGIGEAPKTIEIVSGEVIEGEVVHKGLEHDDSTD